MNLNEQLHRIKKIMNSITNEEFTDYGDLSNWKQLKRDYRKDIQGDEERGTTKIKKKLGQDNLSSLMDDLKTTFDINKIKYVGRGAHGLAFQVDNNRIIKITNDKDEIAVIKRLFNIQNDIEDTIDLDREIPGVINFYKLKYYPNYDFYAILMDKANPLPFEEKKVYDVIHQEMGSYTDSPFWDEFDDEDDDVRDELLDRINDELNQFNIDISYSEIIDYIEKYRELLILLDDNNISTQDLHGGNIGEINGELVHYDVMDYLNTEDEV